MATMLNTPSVSQLTTVTGDGKPSENAQQDCTAAGVDLLCRYALGTPENSVFNPDNFHDKAYWEGYIGGTAAIEYVAFCKSLGVHLHSVDAADYAHAVTLARAIIRDKKQPCLFTRDDPYADQRTHPDWTHVCVFKGEDDAGLTAHDPYINQPVYKTDAGWASILRSSELWIAERITMSTLDTLKQHNWHDDGTTLIAPNSVPVVRGFRGYILAHTWNPDNWPLAAEHGTPQLEGSNPSLGGGTQQVFRWTMLGWTEAHGVFEEWTGQELLYLSKKVADYYKQVQDLQKQLQGGQPVPATDPLASQALAVVRQIKPLFQPF